MMDTSSSNDAYRADVESRMGIVPNFFAPAPEAPEAVQALWSFAKQAYMDNPIPSPVKDRLFVYLSRFCEVRYCIARHCAFLIADPTHEYDQRIASVTKLLKLTPPWDRSSDEILAGLKDRGTATGWPTAETADEELVIVAAASVFVEPRQSDMVRSALRSTLGEQAFEHLLLFLSFIRTAHYWTLVHPELQFEADVQELLRTNEDLARLLLIDKEAGRLEMGVELFEELNQLRELNAKHELERAKERLEAQVRQQDFLIKEVNHRVKNSLQIVASILQLQIRHSDTEATADILRDAVSRVVAVAAVHERLYAHDDPTKVELATFIPTLLQDIGRSYGCEDQIACKAKSATVSSEVAIPLALIVNELVTNAIKHAGPSCRVSVENQQGVLHVTVGDSGNGPPQVKETNRPKGIGVRLVDAFSKQLGATVERRRTDDGYEIELSFHLQKDAV